MRTRNHDPKSSSRKTPKKMSKLAEFVVRQNRESRQGAADTPVKCRRNSPNPTLSPAQLLLLRGTVFLETVGRVSHNGMNRVRRLLVHPCETVCKMQSIPDAVKPEVCLLLGPRRKRIHLCIKYHELRWICRLVWSSLAPTELAFGFSRFCLHLRTLVSGTRQLHQREQLFAKNTNERSFRADRQRPRSFV
jgi:hypothetical protein